jgi:hypothetical protein
LYSYEHLLLLSISILCQGLIGRRRPRAGWLWSGAKDTRRSQASTLLRQHHGDQDIARPGAAAAAVRVPAYLEMNYPQQIEMIRKARKQAAELP